MCKLCERINSVIEVVESLNTLEDWKATLLDSDLAEDDSEMHDIILHDDRNVMMNIIALITATWCLKRGIPLFPACMTITQHMTHLYLYKSPHGTPKPDSES